MSETNMRQRVIKALRPLDAISMENLVGDGTPDVNYIEGWIELKWLRRWPARESTPVTLDHPLEPQQRAWLLRRWRRGGKAYVLLQAGGTDWLLFDGDVAARLVGRVIKSALFEAARLVISDRELEHGLLEFLSP